MKYRKLGRTGLIVSELGFGGHEYRRPLPTTLGRWGEINIKEFDKKQPTRNALIKKAIELGINYFDATQSEEAKSLGIALKEADARNDVYVALMILRPLTKIAGKPRSDWKNIISNDVEEKLDLLQSSYADILNVHMPEIGYSRERFTEIIKALRELKQEGKINWIGASSHEPRFLTELIRTYDCFDSVMIRYNYHLQEARDIVFPICKVLEIGVVVMKPIAWPYYGIPFTYFGEIKKKEEPYTAIQNCIKWILNSEQVSTVVPSMNSISELKENVEAIEIDIKSNDGQLNQYLQKALGPISKKMLKKMLIDQSTDIKYFASRALKEKTD